MKRIHIVINEYGSMIVVEDFYYFNYSCIVMPITKFYVLPETMHRAYVVSAGTPCSYWYVSF